MDLYFHDRSYDRLAFDRAYTHGLPEAVVTLYRKRLQILRAARDLTDLTSLQCLRVRKVASRPRQTLSLYLSPSHRLIVEFHERSSPCQIWIVEIRDVQP